MLVDRVGFAGQERLVDLEAVRRGNLAVGRHLVAGTHADQIVEDDLGQRHFVVRAVAHDGDGRRG